MRADDFNMEHVVRWLAEQCEGFPVEVAVDVEPLDLIVTVTDDAGQEHVVMLDHQQMPEAAVLFNAITVRCALKRMRRDRCALCLGRGFYETRR